jgi:hypothetical protein
LLRIGYKEEIVASLLEVIVVNSTEDGVDYLVKDANGWEHPYIKSIHSKGKCKICGEKKTDHSKKLTHIEETLNKQSILTNQESEYLQEDCKICYNLIKQDELIILKCGHRYCEDCLIEYIKYRVSKSEVTKLFCPLIIC